jgi:hypothetical protein
MSTGRDLGAPIAYLVLAEGTSVQTSDGGDAGTIRRVLAVPDDDIFDGLVLDTPDGDRFVDAEHVGELYERGVVLAVTREELRHLPEPGAAPAAMEARPGDPGEGDSDLGRSLRRAWDMISGKY